VTLRNLVPLVRKRNWKLRSLLAGNLCMKVQWHPATAGSPFILPLLRNTELVYRNYLVLTFVADSLRGEGGGGVSKRLN